MLSLLTFVRERGKLFFTDQLSHAASRGDIAGRQRSKTGCVEIPDLPLNGDFLTVFVHQKDHP